MNWTGKSLISVRPLLAYIDNGTFFRKPISWMYAVFAAMNLFFGLWALYDLVSVEIMKSDSTATRLYLFVSWVFFAIACWVGAQIWWCRINDVLESSRNDSEFYATPVFSHLIQTAGENVGTYIAITGVGVSLVSMISGDTLGVRATPITDSPLPYYSPHLVIVLAPILGYLTIVATRFVAEQIRALAAIASNTKK